MAIEIKPKFSISNLTRIVTIAEDEFNILNFFSRKYEESSDTTFVVFEFMAECLANELQILHSEGILKNYILTSEQTHKIRGRISINDSIKTLWSHGNFNKASVKYHDFTVNNPFNQLIKYTIHYCIIELEKISSNKSELRKNLIEFYSAFDSVNIDENRHFLISVYESIREKKISVLRHYYVNICEICRLIISNIGVSFDEEGSDLEMSTFTLDMANTFEKYLLNSIRLNRGQFPEDTLILDGNNEGSKKFYNQPSNQKANAKPDIVIRQNDEYKIIADAKYKSSSKETDRYQVISHALSYGAKIALLILPKDKNSDHSLIKLGSIGCQFEIHVYEYFFDLASPDLKAEEIKLSQCLNTLLEK